MKIDFDNYLNKKLQYYTEKAPYFNPSKDEIHRS